MYEASSFQNSFLIRSSVTRIGGVCLTLGFPLKWYEGRRYLSCYPAFPRAGGGSLMSNKTLLSVEVEGNERMEQGEGKVLWKVQLGY